MHREAGIEAVGTSSDERETDPERHQDPVLLRPGRRLHHLRPALLLDPDGNDANRLHLWTGTIRAKQSADSPANVRNSDVDYGSSASWPTFPERLEDHGISWMIYQNELTLESGFTTEEDAWLANFGDNPIEWFTQYRVHFAASYRRFIDKRIKRIFPGEIDAARKADRTPPRRNTPRS